MTEFFRRLFSPLSTTVLAVTATTLWLTKLWWIAPLGVLAAVIIAMQSMLSGKQKLEDGDEHSSYDLAPLHYSLRSKFSSVLEEKEKILGELREKKGDSFLNAAELSSRVNELVGNYYDLLLKLEKVRPFIDIAAKEALNRSIEDLKAQIESCSDDVARENLTLALKNKTDQLRSLQELARYEQRVNSQLENLVSALSSLYVRIVQIRLSPDSSLDPTVEIKESINNMLMDVEISEKVTQEFHRIVSENAI